MKAILLLLLTSLSVNAMDRYAALSMIESADNDRAVGACGEVSRFQIMPGEWSKAAPLIPIEHASITPFASAVAVSIQFRRVDVFVAKNHRQPTDFEWYMLWHRPARVFHPTAREAERAQRFANLCQR